MKRQQGFTYLEVLLTALILGLLASLALPLAEVSVQRSREHELRIALREIRTAINAYRRAVDEGRLARSADASGYPPNLAVLADGVLDIKAPKGTKIYFLRRIPRDPMNRDPSLSAELTWGLRSHESPAEQPQPGKDVFDVYSLTEGAGMNGIPYREW